MNIIESNGWKAITPQKRDGQHLSPKQALYLLGVAQGMTHKQIARQHGISPAIVGKAMAVIYYKLQVERATAAVAEAMRRGWISPLCIMLVMFSLTAGMQQQAMRVRPTRQQASSSVRVSQREALA
ncbi:LuxR C-terminal-related transcriptional regulator [uncultured Kushneria sp.]|uniref:response regulator transcription factor n=1 Tax=uncultured Kushneria sp. TaxID=905033 RepID=UPI002638F6F7|nr:LuxR C-terminal-related transcriptional regulator [uncultured Kushneria sp.]